MATTPSPFADPAAPILAADPTLDDNFRADLHDAFYSKNPAELVQHLAPLAIPNDTKDKLFLAKQAMEPPVDPATKIAAVGQLMKGLDPQTLEVMESHPTVFKILAAAVTAPEKKTGSESSTGGQSTGKQAANAGKEGSAAHSPVPQPPRIDGQPHMPPLDPNAYRILASDGSVHDLPKDRIDNARKIDPLLHILNPDG